MILYQGPSRLDGKPIIAIATVGSKNEKTGDMIQTWIMRADMEPTEAIRQRADVSICGNCPERWNLGGACYVVIHNAPLTVYRAWKRGNYHDAAHVARVRDALLSKPLRIGSYGDPAAVPLKIWRDLLASGCGHWTGYTHQWASRKARAYRSILMASCDTVEESHKARANGWRYFLVTKPGEAVPARTVNCLSDARDLQCADCGICDGTRFQDDTARASVWIQVHGALSHRFRLNVIK